MSVFFYADAENAGSTVYAFAKTGTGLYANLDTDAFESYQSGHYANYAITMTEGAPGEWSGTWPTWFPTGVYSMTVRARDGGSPASTDLPIGFGPETYTTTSPPVPGTVPTPAMEFQPPAPLASSLASQPGYMNAGEVRGFSMDFDTQNELLSNGDAAISTGVVVSDGSGLTVGTTTFGRTELLAYLTAVTAGTYTLTFTVSLNDTGGTVIERATSVTVY